MTLTVKTEAGQLFIYRGYHLQTIENDKSINPVRAILLKTK